MQYCRVQRGLLTLVVLGLGVSQGSAQTMPGGQVMVLPRTAEPLPIDEIAPAEREKVRNVITRPTFKGRGAGEAFGGRPEIYDWLLDHPDRALSAWRRLGAIASEIVNHGNGHFSWSDNHGSSITWHTVYDQKNLRMWYAEGRVRAAPLTPLVPVQAVLVLRHGNMAEKDGHSLLMHQTEVFVQTDSRAAALAARMMGGSVARLAEQGLGQLELFFSGLVWYLDQHPERVGRLLHEEKAPAQGVRTAQESSSSTHR
ncbi:hypothetical protein BH10PLA2_BH10PLA2_09890 [soil metagenome]